MQLQFLIRGYELMATDGPHWIRTSYIVSQLRITKIMLRRIIPETSENK